MLHRTPMSMIKKQFVPNKPRRSLSPSITPDKKEDEPKEPVVKKEETEGSTTTEDKKADEDAAPVGEPETSQEHIENWTGANLETLSQWIQISSLQIEVLDLAIKYFRSIVRRNVLLGLVFSTASGSISISQLNSAYQTLVLNIIFTIMSFSIAIFTGLIKIYQIQERLEEFIQLKQEWIGFSVVITAEVQLPVSQRKKAIDLITKHKNKYLDLLKRDVDIPNFIKGKAYKNLYHDRHKQAYLKNCERHKMLKEIWACADDTFFAKAFDRMDNNILQYEDPPVECTWHNCICIMSNRISEFIIDTYKYCANDKDKYIGEKTALSNIILTVIMEEENYQRSKQIVELMNLIQERYNRIKMDKYKAVVRSPSFSAEEV
jgi:hypothetical protein